VILAEVAFVMDPCYMPEGSRKSGLKAAKFLISITQKNQDALLPTNPPPTPRPNTETSEMKPVTLYANEGGLSSTHIVGISSTHISSTSATNTQFTLYGAPSAAAICA
jgi:hypothetical protein